MSVGSSPRRCRRRRLLPPAGELPVAAEPMRGALRAMYLHEFCSLCQALKLSSMVITKHHVSTQAGHVMDSKACVVSLQTQPMLGPRDRCWGHETCCTYIHLNLECKKSVGQGAWNASPETRREMRDLRRRETLLGVEG